MNNAKWVVSLLFLTSSFGMTGCQSLGRWAKKDGGGNNVAMKPNTPAKETGEVDRMWLKEKPSAKAKTDFGHLYLVSGQPSRALAAFNEAIELDKKYAPGYAGLARFHNSNGNPDEALAVLENGFAKCKESAELWNEKAIALSAKGQMAEAVDAMKKAHHLDPNSSLYAENYAGMLAYEGRYEEALRLYQERRGAAPAAFQIAGVAYSRQDIAAAQRYLEMTLQVDPSFAEAREMLASMAGGGGPGGPSVQAVSYQRPASGVGYNPAGGAGYSPAGTGYLPR